MDSQKTIIVGKDVLGKEHSYNLILLDAETGCKLFHEYASIVIMAFPTVRKLLEGGIKTGVVSAITGEGGGAMELLNIVPRILTWERVSDLAKLLLAGGDIDGKPLGDTGIGEPLKGDPIGLYVALWMGIRANFGVYVDPFLALLARWASEEEERREAEDSTRDFENNLSVEIPDGI